MMVYIIIFLITIVLCGFEANLKYITIGGNKVAIKQISFWIIYIYLLILGICRNEFLGADSSSYKIYYWDGNYSAPRLGYINFWSKQRKYNFCFIIALLRKVDNFSM